MRRLIYGAITATVLAGLLAALIPLGLISCDIFWWAFECWFF